MTIPDPRATFAVGHWTDAVARTGCTVVLFDRLVPAVVDVRGGAPGTRETDLLAPDRLVGQVDAVLLSGGSAHGLAAADGVMQYLREHGRGFNTQAGPVPIVSAAVIYDLAVGEATWPTTQSGYSACTVAKPLAHSGTGSIGAGAGATTRKLWPSLPPLAGGFGWSSVRVSEQTTVHALAVVNAVGEIMTGERIDHRSTLLNSVATIDERSATSLIVVVVEGDADRRSLQRIAIAAHDGLARAVVPSHTLWDGDLVFAAATGHSRETDPQTALSLTIAAELAVERAIRASVADDRS